MRPTTNDAGSRKVNALLWTVQALLALVFLFAGGMKLVMPIAALTQPGGPSLPGLLLRFVGALEVLGALGMILPGLLRIRPVLTPVAAAGLVLVMCGAVGATLASGQAAAVPVPIVVGFLAAVVAVGRWKIAPLRAGRRASLDGQPRVIPTTA